jgi:hypothetical protein
MDCHESLVRTRRYLWEKPIYSVIFTCRTCESRVGAKRNFFRYFGGYAKCPRCGSEELKARKKRDGIDTLIKNPISVLQSLTGGKLYHCLFCRIQFYDLRDRVKQRSLRRTATAEKMHHQ